MKNLIKKNYAQVLLVFGTFALMVAIGGYFVNNTLQEVASSAVAMTLEETDNTVRAYLREPKVAFDNIYTALVDILDRDEPQEILQQYMVQSSEMLRMQDDGIVGFLSIYGFIRDEFVSGTNWIPYEGYIPQQRPWYQAAVRTIGIAYTAPYIDASEGVPIISLAQEIYGRNGDYYGVLAMDISIEWLFRYSESLQFIDGGYRVIISQYLYIIAHPEEQFRSMRLQDLGGDYAEIADMLRVERNVNGKRIQDIDGKDSIAFFRQLDNGWFAGIILPVDSYFAEVYRNITTLAFLGFILACILSFILLRMAADKMRSQEESRSKSSFLAMMSHEMRTPMNAIMGMTYIAKSTPSIEKKDYALERIEDASNHLLGVINNILDMSKIEAGKLELNPVSFDFRDMIDKVVNIINFRITEKNQIFTVNIDDGIDDILICDDQRLSQIITNLLSNAVKFTPENGEISLRAKLVENEAEACMIQISVTDNGVGISEQQQESLFNPFQQAQSNTTRLYGGTGLGLAIAKRIVELMGGSITVSSDIGKGATFKFTVKVEKPEEKALTGTESQPDNEQNESQQADNFLGYTALLVEDVEINREIIIALLEPTHLHIISAENGAEAVRIFKETPEYFNIIFMDIQMPVMDGFEATRIIRASNAANSKSIPIIAMTANVFKEDVDNCLNAGMNNHIGKPIDIDTVLQVLRYYLSRQEPGADRRKEERRSSDRRLSSGERRKGNRRK